MTNAPTVAERYVAVLERWITLCEDREGPAPIGPPPAPPPYPGSHEQKPETT